MSKKKITFDLNGCAGDVLDDLKVQFNVRSRGEALRLAITLTAVMAGESVYDEQGRACVTIVCKDGQKKQIVVGKKMPFQPG